jgi:hypothetical protein
MNALQQDELDFETLLNKQEKKFNAFILKNPQIWTLFVHYTFEAIKQGHKHISSDMILHRIRWETSVMTVGSKFKISNDTSPYFARKFHKEYPVYNGFYRTKKISQSFFN